MAGRNAAAAVIRRAIRPGTAAAAEGGFTSAPALARRRYLHGGRDLDPSPERTNAEKVDTLIEKLQQVKIESLEGPRVMEIMQSIELARQRKLSQNIKRSWAFFGVLFSGYWFGYYSVPKH